MSVFRRGGRGFCGEPNSENNYGVRLVVSLICLFMSAGIFSVPVKAADKDKFSAIVDFDSITLHYASSEGQPEKEAIQDGELIEKGKQLVLRYEYTITADQCAKIMPDTLYYLEVSPHLALPDLLDGSKLNVEDVNGTKEQFGTIYADGSSAWVTFLADPDDGNATVLSKYGELEGAYFYLDCRRVETVPSTEKPIEGNSNLYAMKFEDGSELEFGYAEHKPVEAEAEISKKGSLTDKTITWTIDYTPWQNPGPDDKVDLDTPFELRDTIDAGVHSYVSGSVKINDASVSVYASRSDIPKDAETYVLVEDTDDGSRTILTFGGTKFNAGQATAGNQGKPLKITYQTSINDELLLPGGADSKTVTNAAELFAGPAFDNQLGIGDEADVTVRQPVWVEKEGKTVRNPGSGSTTDWTVTFHPNGFAFGKDEELTLHDRLPAGSELVENSVHINGTPATAVSGTDNEFTVLPILTDKQTVTITYQTQVSEDMYDKGTDLGNNIAWFTFQYGDDSYKTPEVTTAVGSEGSSGDSGTATLVKTNTGYDTGTRTITWEVTINPHKAILKSGTFTDDLGVAGPRCTKGQEHKSGLELVGDTDDIIVSLDGKPYSGDLVKLAYENQTITVTVGNVGTQTIVLTYATKVCDPCVFANNTSKTAFINSISTDDMVIGSQTGRSASAESTASVRTTVLTKKPPVYDYASGIMKWEVEVDAAGLPMTDVVLKDTLPAGLTYVKDTFSASPEIQGAAASVQGQELTINLGAVNGITTVTFDTRVDPEILGFGGDKPVVVKNTVHMDGKADGVEFVRVSHKVEQNFSNHGLVKSDSVNNQEELIRYEVLLNPFGLALPENPSLVDTLDGRLQLDPDTLLFYNAKVTGTTKNTDQKPDYEKIGNGRPLKATDFDPDTNSFTVQLPITAGSREPYVLTYTADIIRRETGKYGNSIRFDGGSVLLGGTKNNSADVAGGGGGGGGGVAARKANIVITKIDSETKAPLPGVSFTLYQWNQDSDTRGLPFAQGETDAQGKLSFRVKPEAFYELVETKSAPGYGSVFRWATLPEGARATDSGLLIKAGAAASSLKLELTNEAHTTDIVFRLCNQSGIPMAGTKVRLFKTDPSGGQSAPDMEVIVAADGTVKFSGVRQGETYYIQYPVDNTMIVDMPVQAGEEPKVTLPDGTQAALTADYQVSGVTAQDQQWKLTVNKVIGGSKTPLAGATIGLYADENCRTLIRTGVSGSSGAVVFEGLIKGQNYWVKETAAPKGYQLNSRNYAGSEGNPDVTIDNVPEPVRPGDSGGGSGSGGSGSGSGSGSGNGSGSGSGGGSGSVSMPGVPGTFDEADMPDSPDMSEAWKMSGEADRPGEASMSDETGIPDEAGIPGESHVSENSGSGNVNSVTDASDSPQTGDNTWVFITVTLVSGILLAAMTLYRLLRSKKREKE